MSDLDFLINTAGGGTSAFRLSVAGCVWPDLSGNAKEMLVIHSSGGIKVIGGELANEGTLVLSCTTGATDIFQWQGRSSVGNFGTLASIDHDGRGRFNFVELSSGGAGTPVAAGGVALPVLETPLLSQAVGLMYVHDLGSGAGSNRYQLRAYNNSSGWNIYTLSP